MKKIMSILLIMPLFLSALSTISFAKNDNSGYSNVETEYICSKYNDTKIMLDALFGSSEALAYWNMIEKTKEDAALNWSVDAASKLIGEYPDKHDCSEILANLMTMQSGDIAEQVQNQSQFDNLKNGFDYTMDIVNIAESFVGGANILESISPIIDAATGGAEVIIDNVEAAKYYESAIRDYSQSKMFLEAISKYAENEDLKNVAASLLLANDNLLEKRFEYLIDSTASLADYGAEFFVENMSFELLKTTDLYKTDETVKWYVDCGEKLRKSISSLFSAGEFTFRMTMLAGDIGFGTSDTFNRYQEMKIVSDIAGAIVKANSQIIIDPEVETVLTDIQTKCDYYKMLIMSHVRGEYLVYKLLINDAGLLSDFQALFDSFKAPEDTIDNWYTKQTNYFTKYYNIINKMFDLSNMEIVHGQYDVSDIPGGAVEFNGHHYYIYNFDVFSADKSNTWENALKYCKENNGYLATISSPEENEFIFEYMKQQGYESAYFGLSDSETEGIWQWCNDETVMYTNWANGEPSGEMSENYGMFYYKFVDGKWNDGRCSDSITGFICEWGEYTVNSMNKSQKSTRTTSDERDIVVVLDTSGSMSGKPIEETKTAASKFVDTVLEQDASIGIVTYDNSASMLSDFSVDGQSLKSAANNISDGGGTNIESGLAKAKEMLATSSAKKKIIVLMSDGEPNDGKVGDELISYADSIRADGTYIYTLGFFENMGSGKSDAQILMEKIASEGCHYEVANADDLKFFFGDIADQINGQKYIYVRIACPVDVKVTSNGETLRSDGDNPNERTSFGSLTFEENKNESESGSDNRIKILRLKDGTDYDVQIEGNGSGKMNYTIGFMDESGEYSDMRKFSNLEISPKTQIDTVASNTSSTTLNVDSDGDGKYDLKYKAKANSAGEIVDYSYIRYIIYIIGILIILLIFYIQIKKWERKSAEKAIKKKAAIKRFCVRCGNMVSGDKKFCPKCGSKME